MMCGIHRVEKRGRQAVGGLQAEANRNAEHEKNFDGSDIDWSRTQDNVRLVSSDNWLKDINKTIQDAGVEHVRKDAIVMLDGLYTASPEFFKRICYEEQIQYFRDCLQFHIDTYCHGDASLVKNAVVHFDETTPHMQVCSVPITEDGRLSAKDVMGNKAQYHQRQDAFYEKVTKNYHLERGDVQEHGREKKHRDQMEYKAEQAEAKAVEMASEIEHNKAVIGKQIKQYNEQKEALEKLPAKRDELAKVEQEIETARKDLGKTLELKAKASKIRTPFGDKDLVTMHRNSYDSLYEIAREAREHMKDAHDTKKSIAGREEAVKAKEAEIEPLHQQAKQARAEAEKYKDDIEGYIIGTARNLVKEEIKKAEPAITDREKRMEQFLDGFNHNGQTLLQEFNHKEKERREKLEREVMAKAERSARM